MADLTEKKDPKISAEDILGWLKVAGYGVGITAMLLGSGYAIGWYVGYGTSIRDVLRWMQAHEPQSFEAFKHEFHDLVLNLRV